MKKIYLFSAKSKIFSVIMTIYFFCIAFLVLYLSKGKKIYIDIIFLFLFFCFSFCFFLTFYQRILIKSKKITFYIFPYFIFRKNSFPFDDIADIYLNSISGGSFITLEIKGEKISIPGYYSFKYYFMPYKKMMLERQKKNQAIIETIKKEIKK